VLILGTRTRTAVLAMLTLLCRACGNPSAHQVSRRQTWFTLFFLPVFPVGSGKYSTLCTYCGAATRIDKDEAERLQAQPDRPAGSAGLDSPGSGALPTGDADRGTA